MSNLEQMQASRTATAVAGALTYPVQTPTQVVEQQPGVGILDQLPDGQLFNRRGVEAFNRARQEALSQGLDIKVVSALRAEPAMPLYPFRGRRSAASCSTHDLERGAIGIDIDKWWQVKEILEKHGFRWKNHPDHPGHFDFVGHTGDV